MPHAAPAHKSFADRTSLYQEITDKIIRELEQGRVPWVQPWAGVPAPLGLPKNAATGRPYSGINILILWLACTERGFTGQNWLTFRQALKLGAHVRKGRKASPSFMPTASFPTANAPAPPKPATSPTRFRSSSASRSLMPTSARMFRPISRRRRNRSPKT
jgi:N-terminal domain of anti-restriction factor ArdC